MSRCHQNISLLFSSYHISHLKVKKNENVVPRREKSMVIFCFKFPLPPSMCLYIHLMFEESHTSIF